MMVMASPARLEGGPTDIVWEDLSTYCFASTGTAVAHETDRVVQRPPSDCQDLLNAGQVFSGVYIVYRYV